MYYSDIIYKYMIIVYVLFLLMERKYIKECIKDFLVVRNYYRREDIFEDKIRVIVQELNYYLVDMEIFLVIGCKRVLEKVIYVMDEE